MCGTCGCGSDEQKIEGVVHNHMHSNDSNEYKLIDVEQDILSKNQEYANRVRTMLNQHKIIALNLVSSPGAGKTTLLTKTIELINNELSCAVIEGDQQTSNDADRIRQAGAIAVQINTGKGCHLDAHMVEHALEQIDLESTKILFIENVGNLVCPSAFDLGEQHKVVILSVTEGEDKPIKYPDMFAASDYMIINKIDLLPYLDFNLDKCIEYAKQVNPNINIIKLSVKSGEGLDEWIKLLQEKSSSQLELNLAG